MWKMCNTPLATGESGLSGSPLQVILMDEYHKFNPLLLPDVFLIAVLEKIDYFHTSGLSFQSKLMLKP